MFFFCLHSVGVRLVAWRLPSASEIKGENARFFFSACDVEICVSACAVSHSHSTDGGRPPRLQFSLHSDFYPMCMRNSPFMSAKFGSAHCCRHAKRQMTLNLRRGRLIIHHDTQQYNRTIEGGRERERAGELTTPQNSCDKSDKGRAQKTPKLNFIHAKMNPSAERTRRTRNTR